MQVKEVRIVKDPTTGRAKGTAFIEYYDAAGVASATEKASKTIKAQDSATGKFTDVHLKVAQALTRDDAQNLMKTRSARNDKGNK